MESEASSDSDQETSLANTESLVTVTGVEPHFVDDIIRERMDVRGVSCICYCSRYF